MRPQVEVGGVKVNSGSVTRLVSADLGIGFINLDQMSNWGRHLPGRSEVFRYLGWRCSPAWGRMTDAGIWALRSPCGCHLGMAWVRTTFVDSVG